MRGQPSAGGIIWHGRLLVATCAVLFLCSTGTGEAALNQGDMAAPAFLVDPNGRTVALDTLLGQGPVLLAFMSPHCQPCEESLPALIDIATTYGPTHGLAVVLVYLTTTDSLDRARTALGSDTPLSLFRDSTVSGQFVTASAYGVWGTPTSFLIDREGIIRWRKVGQSRHPIHPEADLDRCIVVAINQLEAASQ